MQTLDDYQRAIDGFEDTYDYDMTYQREMLGADPDSFRVFARAQGMSTTRKHLPRDAHFVARVAAMIGERCVACAILCLRMAVEAGVDRALLAQVLEDPAGLPAELRDIRAHAIAVARDEPADAARLERLRGAFGRSGVSELAVVLAGCRLFTTVKRTFGMTAWRPIAAGDY